jgi:hypothetical protein
METFLENTNLINQINDLRQTMIAVGQNKGLNHPDTIKFSQELDKLIIRYQSIN